MYLLTAGLVGHSELSPGLGVSWGGRKTNRGDGIGMGTFETGTEICSCRFALVVPRIEGS